MFKHWGPLRGATPRRVLLPRGHRPLRANESRRGMRQGKLIGASALVAPSANPVNHRVFERKLRLKPHGRGQACLGVTHHVAPQPPLYGAIGWGRHWPPMCIKLAAGLNEFTRRPPSRQALVEHSTLFLSCWTERRVPIDPNGVTLRTRPQVRQDHPLSLSISISGGKETYEDSPSDSERTGNSPT
ncbi:Unknown protein [Striga hermonthica]|uniref:Uncharacterized protein n=1 Tax=Striga hermonthica TaxID=68872 RepID=A0A9N7NE36_STRHE|nr:Unknown protein [Striga hermonthica]